VHNEAIYSIQKQDINLGPFVQFIWITYTEFYELNTVHWNILTQTIWSVVSIFTCNCIA